MAASRPDGDALRTRNGHRNGVMAVSFNPDGRQLISVSDDQTITRWDAETGTELRSLNVNDFEDPSAWFSPDGGRLASAGGEVGLWDAKEGRKLHALIGHAAAITRVSYRPDRRGRSPAGVEMMMLPMARGCDSSPTVPSEMEPL